MPITPEQADRQLVEMAEREVSETISKIHSIIDRNLARGNRKIPMSSGYLDDVDDAILSVALDPYRSHWDINFYRHWFWPHYIQFTPKED